MVVLLDAARQGFFRLEYRRLLPPNVYRSALFSLDPSWSAAPPSAGSLF